MAFSGIDWETVFRADVPLLEMVVRGSVMYLAVFVMLRSTLRRSAGELSMLDFIFVLLVANGAANAMGGEHVSVSGGVVLVGTVVAWNYGLNSLSYFSPFVERLLSPAPLPIVRDGKLIRRNMRREFLSKQEWMGQLREQGVEDLAVVKSAYLEGDGNISVITHDGDG